MFPAVVPSDVHALTCLHRLHRRAPLAVSYLTWIDEPLPALRRPILVLAFEVSVRHRRRGHLRATWMTDGRAVRSIARIDPDPFYDFSDRRPMVWLDEAGDRILSWPENEAKVVLSPVRVTISSCSPASSPMSAGGASPSPSWNWRPARGARRW